MRGWGCTSRGRRGSTYVKQAFVSARLTTPSVQAGLIGKDVNEGAKDVRARLGLHQSWQEAQDLKDVRALLHGIKNGFRGNNQGVMDEAVREDCLG